MASFGQGRTWRHYSLDSHPFGGPRFMNGVLYRILTTRGESARGRLEKGNEAMQGTEIRLTLARALDDPPQFSDEHQNELEGAQATLRKGGVSVTGFEAYPAGPSHLGEFLISLTPQAITAVTAVAVAWLHGRSRRKVRVRFRGVEAEASTPAEIAELLKRAADFQAGAHKDHSEDA